MKAVLPEEPTVQLIWPWQDRNRRFSALKASAFALMLVPAIRLIYQLDTGEFGFYPLSLGGLVYWSGVWATAILLLAIAVTPAITILRWPALIDVRRMIGVTALAYTIAHLFIYFALRMWNFDHHDRDGDAAHIDHGNALDHRSHRARRDLARRGDPLHGREVLAAAAQCGLCDHRARDAARALVARLVPGAVRDERRVRLAHGMARAEPLRARRRRQGARYSRGQHVPVRGGPRSLVRLAQARLRAVMDAGQ